MTLPIYVLPILITISLLIWLFTRKYEDYDLRPPIDVLMFFCGILITWLIYFIIF